jgi:hypothetical protein
MIVTIIHNSSCPDRCSNASQLPYARPIFSTRRLSISILFLTSRVYFFRSSLSSSLSPAGAASFEPREVFSRLPSYKHEMGTKLPSALHSHPWAALSAAPSEAESGTETASVLRPYKWMVISVRHNVTGSLDNQNQGAGLCNYQVSEL